MWFSETAWPPVVICGVAAAFLTAAWYQNRRSMLLVAAAAMLPLAAAILVFEANVVTDAERIEANVYGVTSAFQQADAERTLDYFSPQANKERELVSLALALVEVEDDLRITDLRVRMLAENSRAISHFRANATASYQGYRDRFPTRWELTWQKIADDWKIVRIRRLQLLDDREMQPMATSQ